MVVSYLALSLSLSAIALKNPCNLNIILRSECVLWSDEFSWELRIHCVHEFSEKDGKTTQNPYIERVLNLMFSEEAEAKRLKI